MKSILILISLGAISMLGSSCKDTTETSATAKEINEGKELVMKSIEAHGGKDKWYANGQLQFRWRYNMTDRGPDAVVDTTQTVDTTTLAVMHEVTDSPIKFGLNNGEAWLSPKGADFGRPPRFWALTPYYFLGIPFIFNDDGANFELLTEPMEFEGKDYTQVKVTYDPDSGDAPDDYYVLLIDPETFITRGAYYTNTNKLLGRKTVGPPKFMTLDNLQDVNGIKLASGHRTMKMVDNKITDQMRFTEVTNVKFLPTGTVDLSTPAPDLIIK